MAIIYMHPGLAKPLGKCTPTTYGIRDIQKDKGRTQHRFKPPDPNIAINPTHEPATYHHLINQKMFNSQIIENFYYPL